jgi:putative nucleotidyltransferase with HDIG domain
MGVRPRANLAYLSLFTLGLIVVISAILAVPNTLPGRVELAPGQPAPRDFYAPQHLRYDSEVLTAVDRETARQAVGPVYDSNTTLVATNRRRLVDLLTRIENLRSSDTPPDPGHSIAGRALSDSGLEAADITAVLAATPERWTRLRAEALRIYDTQMVSGKISDPTTLEQVRTNLPTMVSYELNGDERRAVAALLRPLLAVNLTLNTAATEERRDEAAAAVQAHVVEVQQDEVVLRTGQIADAAAIEKLEKLGLRNPAPSASNAGAVFGCVGILGLLLHFYLLRLLPGVTQQRRPLLLLGLVLVVPTLAMRLIVPGHAVWPYLLPVAACSMLVAVLLDANLAILVTMILGVFAALLTQGTFELTFYYWVGGCAAVFAIWKAERVSTFVLSGVYATLSSLAAILLVRLVENQHLDEKAVGILLAAASINGALAASLTFATFSLLGSLFGITTVLQLLELAHPTQPLLRRLMREAPGTYHHSLVVSNLTEHAAEMVGADPLLARVVAYYHDIGKVLNPQAFIENQAGNGNIHDNLDPHTSARIIREHITGGQQLARRYRLPRRIEDCIMQHHGTTVVKYFYHKAHEADPSTDIEDFRCPGPKPQSKEAAILMLADSIEATVRAVAGSGTLDPPTPAGPDAVPAPNSIAGIIRRTIRERLEDGQLDECDLTLRDLARIEAGFAVMLNGIYHPRITYPGQTPATALAVVAAPRLPAPPSTGGFARIRRPLFPGAPSPRNGSDSSAPLIVTISGPAQREPDTLIEGESR